MSAKTRGSILMRIDIYKSGEVEVVDDQGKRLAPISAEQLGRTLPGGEFARSDICTILVRNPDGGWVCVGGNWYYLH